MTLEVVPISRRIRIFPPSDNLEDSVMDVVLKLIRLIAGVVDTIASSATLKGEEGERDQSAVSISSHIMQR